MTYEEPASKAKTASVLRSARSLRQQLGDGDTKVELTITGGGGQDQPVGELTAVPCIFDITSPSRDAANAHFNDFVEVGCDCSQPTQGDDGQWFVSCNCPDEE